ncbi:MAG: hypothetical protein HYY67_00365 [Thaumarchaeota archaeon]|nr:hypothetical protein [Nitrososphaerota archaeon]
MQHFPVEPDLVYPWNKNVWLFSLRLPFSFVFLGLITITQALAPDFHLDRYVMTLLASFFGLVVGAHFIDVASNAKKFSPYFAIPKKLMLAIGLSSVIVGILIGTYMAVTWSIWFFLFVIIEGLVAVLYPLQKPRMMHSYASFAASWGLIPVLASYYIQALSLSLLAVGIAIFFAFSVTIMHHLAVISKNSATSRDAFYLLSLYRYSVYITSLVLLFSRFV